ncbi:MAG: tetratricopeptide repeat protein, partial [Phycisphaerae bacterium]|nr:tetratricopeptide repeat protein [Phycisphaerae bacterium]
MRCVKLLVLAVAVIAAGGCLEEKSEYFINPDGSGKVIYESSLPSMDMGMGMVAPPQDPNAKVAETLQIITAQSKGVDAWKDVSCNLTPDGKIHFKGTAYFKNIDNFEIHNGMFKFPMKRNEKGQIVIGFDTKDMEEWDSGEMPENPSDEQIDQQVQQAKAQYSQSRMMMAPFMSSLKVEAVLHLPGTIADVNNFQRVDDKTVRIAVDGQRLLAAMDAIMSDDQLLREQIRAGKVPTDDDITMNEKMFGQKAGVQVIVEPADENNFDYNAEVMAAKSGDDMMNVESSVEILTAADSNEVTADYSRSIDEQFNEVFQKLRSKDMEGAIALLKGIIANTNATPKEIAKAYDRLGMCYLRMDDKEKAVEQFEAIIAK